MEWTLICDHATRAPDGRMVPDCTKQLGAAARDDDAARARVLESARAAGWDIDGVDHRCPNHPRLS